MPLTVRIAPHQRGILADAHFLAANTRERSGLVAETGGINAATAARCVGEQAHLVAETGGIYAAAAALGVGSAALGVESASAGRS